MCVCIFVCVCLFVISLNIFHLRIGTLNNNCRLIYTYFCKCTHMSKMFGTFNVWWWNILFLIRLYTLKLYVCVWKELNTVPSLNYHEQQFFVRYTFFFKSFFSIDNFLSWWKMYIWQHSTYISTLFLNSFIHAQILCCWGVFILPQTNKIQTNKNQTNNIIISSINTYSIKQKNIQQHTTTTTTNYNRVVY